MRPLALAQRAAIRGTLALPTRLRARLFGPPPVNDRGVSLDEGTWAMLSLSERLGRDPLPLSDPARARAAMRLSCETSAARPPPVARLEALTLPGGRAARLYRPAEDGRPLLVFFHGGGWVVGDLDTHDTLCRRICAEAGWAVLATDYRLAPEHPFPAALDDARAAWHFAAAMGIDHIAVGGDSAGGNIAASLCLSLRDAGERLPWQQVLIYPGLDMTGAQPSRRTLSEGYLLTGAKIDGYRDHYAPPDRTDPRASPLLAADLSGLPDTVMITAGFDPLRDEGEAYALRLSEAGVAVTHIDAEDQIHGFASMDGVLPAADRWLGVLLRALTLPRR